MRKILLIIGLFLTISLSGQILPGIVASQGGGGYLARSADYQAVYDAMPTKPSLVNAQIQDSLVFSLDSAGYWDRTDYLLVFAVEHENASLINWKSPGVSDADNVSSTAWAQYEGYTGAAGDYISTNWNPSTDGDNFVKLSGSGGAYMMNNVADEGAAFGATDGTGRFVLYPRTPANVVTARVNTNTDNTGGNSDGQGLFICTRRANDDVEIYRNGTGIDTQADAATNVPNSEILILRRYGSDTSMTNEIALFFVMDGLTDTDAEKVSIIYNKYMKRIGKSVY